jgi:hypothetical protein
MALSDTQSNPSLVVQSLDELRSLPIAALRDGERAAFGSDTYELDLDSFAPEGATVVAARPAIVGNFPPVVVDPTIPGRWLLLSGGSGGAPFSRTFYTDPLTSTPLADQDGSVGKPFSTLSAALALAATFGGDCAIVMTAGDYLESVVIPPATALLNNVTLVGQGLESTKITPPGNQSAFRWFPALPGGASPCQNFRISGVHLRAKDGGYAVDLDGTLVTAALFFGAIGPVIAPQAEGMVFQNCLVEGMRLVKTGFACLDTTTVVQPPDASLNDIAIFENCAITICDTAVFGNGTRVVLRHNDPLALKLFSLLFFASTKVINGPVLTLEGFPDFACDPSSFLSNGLDATALTADGNPTILYFTGTCGFIGPAPFDVVFPNSDLFGEPFLAAPGARFIGPVSISKDPVAVNLTEVNMRGATFVASAFGDLTFTNALNVDILGAAYAQLALTPGALAAQVLRDKIVYADAPITPAGPDLFRINPPLPPGTAYSVVALPSAGNLFRLAGQTKTNTDFELVNDSPNADTVDVVATIRS